MVALALTGRTPAHLLAVLSECVCGSVKMLVRTAAAVVCGKCMFYVYVLACVSVRVSICIPHPLRVCARVCACVRAFVRVFILSPCLWSYQSRQVGDGARSSGIGDKGGYQVLLGLDQVLY